MKDHSSHTIEKLASEFQIQRDEIAQQLLNINEENRINRKMILMNEIVDFNAPLVLPVIIPVLIRIQAIDFLLSHHKELTRKLSMEELMKFSEMYNRVTLFNKNIKSLSDLKQKFSKIKSI
jgi:hypothetical protein